MARFYPGCRVRIKWSVNWPELAGQEGVIWDLSGVRFSLPVLEAGTWLVAPDSWTTPVCPFMTEKAQLFGPHESQLEPLYPDRELVPWESCLWQPTPETVEA